MANIDRIVNVQISLNTAGISEQGFSTMLIAGWHSYTNEHVITVTDANELLELGFKATDKIYLAAVDAFSQTPKPKEVKIGRLQCDGVKLTLDSVEKDGLYMLTVKHVSKSGALESVSASYTAKADDGVVEVLQGLADSVIGYTASVVDNELYIKGDDIVVEPVAPLKVSGFVKKNISIAENMAAILSADSDFYGIILADRERENILAMADWAEAETKLFVTCSGEDGMDNGEVTADIGSELEANNYFRTAIWYHTEYDSDYPDSGAMARCFAIEPGGETWANKRLSGISVDNLTETQYKALTKKNINTFEKFRNIAITQNGVVSAGEWIDVIRFRDWLVEQIRVEEFNMLINRDKLPYTDAGIAIVENVLNKVLKKGQDRGGIAPTEYDEDGNKILGYKITVPKASSISANKKASRVLSDVTFTARLAGAIHAMEIKGSLTYENLIEG